MPIPIQPAAQSGVIPCTRLGAILSAVVALIYFGFLGAGAIVPQAFARPAFGHVPWSFVLGAGMLLIAVASTGVYVLLSNAAETNAGESKAGGSA